MGCGELKLDGGIGVEVGDRLGQDGVQDAVVGVSGGEEDTQGVGLPSGLSWKEEKD